MLLFAGALIFTSCSSEETNPLLAKWDTPFETPPFDKITTEHYLPAFERQLKYIMTRLIRLLKTLKKQHSLTQLKHLTTAALY